MPPTRSISQLRGPVTRAAWGVRPSWLHTAAPSQSSGLNWSDIKGGLSGGGGGQLDLSALLSELFSGGGFGGSAGPLPPSAEELALLQAQADFYGAQADLLPQQFQAEQERNNILDYLQALQVGGNLKLGQGQLELDRERLAEEIALARDRLEQEGALNTRQLDLMEEEMRHKFGIDEQEMALARQRLGVEREVGLAGPRAQLQIAQGEAAANPRRVLEAIFLQGGRTPTPGATRLQNMALPDYRLKEGGVVRSFAGSNVISRLRGAMGPVPRRPTATATPAPPMRPAPQAAPLPAAPTPISTPGPPLGPPTPTPGSELRALNTAFGGKASEFFNTIRGGGGGRDLAQRLVELANWLDANNVTAEEFVRGLRSRDQQGRPHNPVR